MKSDHTNIMKSKEKKTFNIDASKKNERYTVNAPSVANNNVMFAPAKSKTINSYAPGVVNIHTLNVGRMDSEEVDVDETKSIKKTKTQNSKKHIKKSSKKNNKKVSNSEEAHSGMGLRLGVDADGGILNPVNAFKTLGNLNPLNVLSSLTKGGQRSDSKVKLVNRNGFNLFGGFGLL